LFLRNFYGFFAEQDLRIINDFRVKDMQASFKAGVLGDLVQATLQSSIAKLAVFR